MRCRCTSASTCAAACTSCCRWTGRRRSPSAWRASPATCARSCASATSGTAASPAKARRCACGSAMPPPATRREVIASNLPDLNVAEREDGQDWLLVATLKPEAIKRTQEYALKQNITTLHNRINELGVAEPVIQQQGADRVLVQLPGVQDTAKAKD